MPISCRDPVRPPTSTLSLFQKQLQIYLLFQKMLKNDSKNLYFHLYTFNMIYKSFSYLTSLFCRGPVNASTPIFSNIYLTETTNLIVVVNSIKNSCQSPFLYTKCLKITYQSNSYLMSISVRGPVNPSTPFFLPISVLHKQ